jgi:hypothetical protein
MKRTLLLPLSLTLVLAAQTFAANDAKLITMTVPAVVEPDADFTASITLKNTGDTTWTTADGYALGSESLKDNTRWGTSRLALTADVAPGAQATFTGTFHSPAIPGAQVFAWKMIQENVESFGEPAVTSIKLGAAAKFAPGDVVVLQIGDGVNATATSGSPIIINSYSPSGGPVKFQVAIPTLGTNAFIQGANAFTGMIDLTSDEHQLVFSGYNTNLPYSVSVEAAGSPVPRAIGTVDANGKFVFQVRVSSGPAGTAGAPTFIGGTVRSAVGDGKGNFWIGAQNGGIQYAGTNFPAVKIDNAGNGAIRDMMMVNGSIFFSTSQFPSSPTSGIVAFAGAPTTPTSPVLVIEDTGTVIPGASGTANPKGFFVNKAMTIAYVVDMRSVSTGGGIYRFNGTGAGTPGSWTYAYTLVNNVNSGLFQELAVDFSGANPVIYATAGTAAGNYLLKATDTGKDTTAFALLETADPLTIFHGLTFAPTEAISEPPSLTIRRDGAQVTITFTGVLEISDSVSGGWQTLTPPPTTPYVFTPTEGTHFYRARGN